MACARAALVAVAQGARRPRRGRRRALTHVERRFFCAYGTAGTERGTENDAESISSLRREKSVLGHFVERQRQLYYNDTRGEGRDGEGDAEVRVTDEEYDAVLKRLREVEALLDCREATCGSATTSSSSSSSPATITTTTFGTGVVAHGGVVGSQPLASSSTVKVRHRRRMLSLASCTDEKSVEEFMRKCVARAAMADGAELRGGWVVEPKVDGLAVRIEYRPAGYSDDDGKRRFDLSLVATRGDGNIGEDVTSTFLAATDATQVPRSIAAKVEMETMEGSADGGVDDIEAQGPCIEVRGEVYMALSDFRNLQQGDTSGDEDDENGAAAKRRRQLSSPRNVASGTLRLLDTEEARRRRLRLFPYSVEFIGMVPVDTHVYGESSCDEVLHSSRMKWLYSHNFVNASSSSSSSSLGTAQSRPGVGHADWHRHVCSTMASAVSAATELMSSRDDFDFETDGVVVKVNDVGVQEMLGTTSSEPRHALALKPVGSTSVSTLTSIEVTIGKSGAIVPVAIVDPVVINGVTCARASLHNVGLVERMGLTIGDQVTVRRAGDVIPQIVSVLRAPGSDERERTAWQAPTSCPWCATTLVRVSGDSLLYCPRAAQECPGQAVRVLEHFVSVLVPNVSKGIVEQLHEAGILQTVPDLFRLSKERLVALPGWQESRAEIFLRGIASSRDAPLDKVLGALAIRHVGSTTAAVLAARYGSLQNIAASLHIHVNDYSSTATESDTAGDARLDELQRLEGVGALVAASIRDWFANETNYALVMDLLSLGVKGIHRSSSSSSAAAAASAASSSGVLAGHVVAMTGRVKDTNVSRAAIRAFIEASGGTFSDSVTKKCSILVTGDADVRATSKKAATASRMGTRVMPWPEFLQQFDTANHFTSS